MTKQQAIEAMKLGAIVSHDLIHFQIRSDDKGLQYHNDENDTIPSTHFWSVYNKEEFETGWSLVMRKPCKVSQNYRDRWSELPEGECELYEGETVDLFYNPGIGSLHVMKENGTMVYVAGFSGHILNPIK